MTAAEEASLKKFLRPGLYGELRLGAYCPENPYFEGLDYGSAGWYRCNPLYHVEREKGTDSYLLLFTVAGRGDVCTGSTQLTATPDTILILPPSVYHTYGVPKGYTWEFYWTHISGSHAGQILSYVLKCRSNAIPVSVSPFVRLFEEQLLQNTTGDYWLLDRSINKLLQMLEELPDGVEGQGFNFVLNSLLSELEGRSSFSLKEFCERHYMSEAYLIRQFRARFGVPPYAYFRQQKLVHAGQKLKYTDIPIKNIASDAGYGSTAAFGLSFRRYSGMSPTAYRAQYKVYQNEPSGFEN